MIEYKWPVVKEFTIKKLLLPFFAFHIIFFVYSNIVFESTIRDIDHGEFPNYTKRLSNYVCFILLLLLSGYFFY